MAAEAPAASPPAVVVVWVLVVLPGSSEVGEAMMETGRSWTSGWGSAPLGVVMSVTCTHRCGGTSGLMQAHGGGDTQDLPRFATCLGPVAAAAAVAVVTWLAKVAGVARVVMGVAREPVTVPRLDTPAETHTR